MMRINGFNGMNTQTGTLGMSQANDAVSKNIQNQIANAQQKLQDLSSNEEMSLEDKQKKRQEIQQEIANLNQQLRQTTTVQRKQKQRKIHLKKKKRHREMQMLLPNRLISVCSSGESIGTKPQND